MNYKEISALSDKERADKVKEIELELMKENAQIASGTAPKNPGRIKEYKKTIARIQTLERGNQ